MFQNTHPHALPLGHAKFLSIRAQVSAHLIRQTLPTLALITRFQGQPQSLERDNVLQNGQYATPVTGLLQMRRIHGAALYCTNLAVHRKGRRHCHHCPSPWH